MKTFSEYKTFVTNIFNNVAKYAYQADYKHVSENISAIKKEFLEKELTVVTCGEMRRGKSSLLSAFLEEEMIFPVDISTCTNVVTIVRYGETEKIEVILESNKDGQAIYETKVISRSQIEEYVTEYGNENNNKNVNCLNISIPNKKLKEGLIFVDTPGLGSLNFQHGQVTYGFLPNADILLFVSDILSPLTESELTFLEKAYEHCKNVVFPLTKIDKCTKEQTDAIIEDNIVKIMGRIKIKREDIKIIPVSSKAKLSYIKLKESVASVENIEAAEAEKVNKALHNSNFTCLEDTIWKIISDNRTRIILLPFLSRLNEEIKKMQSNTAIQIDALNNDIETSKRLENELRSKMEKRSLLLTEGAKWKNDLQYQLNNISIDLISTIQDENITINEELNRLLNQPGAQDNIENISFEINNLLLSLVHSTKETIMCKTLDINDGISEELGLTLDVNEDVLEKISFNRKDKIEYEKSKSSTVNNIIKNGRNIGANSMGGAAMGGVVGAVLGGIVGLFVAGPAGMLVGGKLGAGYGAYAGAGFGTVKGTVDVVKGGKAEDIPAIKFSFNNYINKSINNIRNTINISIREITKTMMDNLTKQIQDQIHQLDNLAGQIQSNLKLSAAEIPVKKNNLINQKNMLDGFGKAVTETANEISR